MKRITLACLIFIFCVPVGLIAQNIQVNGKVFTSKDKSPLENVSISITSQRKGTNSQKDGTFSISAEKGQTLQFTSVNMKPKYYKVSNSVTDLAVFMDEAEDNLSDVVVVAYSTVKKSSFTGAAASIKNTLIENRSNTSFQESLQGNIAGVQSSNGSGNPGAMPDIRIRGIGSINASSAPLYVIDGVPVVTSDIAGSGQSNPLAGLNPNDIQNLTVLKDASATSLYGSRAANGVILITTKRGNSGKAKISFSMQQGFNNPTIRDNQKPLNTSEYLQYYKEGWINAGGNANNYDSLLLSKGVDKNVNTDWYGLTFRQGKYNQYNLNINGGNEKTTYFISGNIYKAQGSIKTEDFEKASYRININSLVTNRWTVRGGLSGNYQNSSDFSENTTAANPVRNFYRLVPWISPYLSDGITWNMGFNTQYNPIAVFETLKKENKIYNVSANGFSEYKIIDGLTLESTFGVDFNHAYRTIIQDARVGATYIARNGQIEDYSNDVTNIIATNILRYKKSFNEKHNLELFVGYETQSRNDRDLNVIVNNITPGTITPAGGSVVRAGTGAGTSNAMTGKFANGSYSFNDRYFLTGSLRQDVSSKFALNYQSANFWSVGGGWNISKEQFFTSNWINELRLRGSYGYTGNNNGFGNFQSQGLYTVGADYNSNSGITLSQLANNNLTWEKNNPLNFGLDFNLLKGRMTGSIDWYTRTTSNLILDQPIPSSNGVTSITVNSGAMKNTGIELALSTVVINPNNNNGFKWVIDLNYTQNKNEITKIDSSFSNNADYYRRVGYDYYTMYQRSYAGVNPANGEALWHANEAKDSTTNLYTPSLPRFIDGSATPKFYGSITNAFTYKNFGFRFQLYVYWGNKIYDDFGPLYHSDAGTGLIDLSNGITKDEYARRWTTPGQFTDVPKPVYLGTQSGGSSFGSTRFLYDGSYIRLRDVSLSYTLKSDDFVKSKLKFNSAKFYVTGQNLFTYMKDKRLYTDPEVGLDGKLTGRPPVFSTLIFGLDINF
jgi:TonB-linked SusC/RagA family outer membrane protein